MFTSADRLTAPTITDSSNEPHKSLLVRVIGQAIDDLPSSRWQHDVEAFFQGPVFRRYCLILGWNQEWVRGRIL